MLLTFGPVLAGFISRLYSTYMQEKSWGGAFSTSPDSQLTQQALMLACESRGRPKNVLFHSDQGSHYSRLSYRPHLWQYQIKQPGKLLGSSPMARFFSQNTLKKFFTRTLPLKYFNICIYDSFLF
ncbi:hypothetical protein CJJ19_00570 [Candidatus Williamhamiltonella defendens]|nr:hypothetical protein CJJ19_00570 [Candidatus Hamiltonella defensa]